MQSKTSLDGIILNNRYQFIKKIGLGTYGLIYLVKDLCDNGKLLAAKFILKNAPKFTNKCEIQKYIETHVNNIDTINIPQLSISSFKSNINASYMKEIALHLKVHQHENIATIHQVFETDITMIVIMDYFPQGDLFKNIIENNIFKNNPILMKNVILQLINILSYCHQNSIFHCDLKPENIMVNYNRNYIRKPNSPIVNLQECQIYLIDFGLSMSSNLISGDSCRGSSFYMAPERITNYGSSPYIKSMIDLSKYHYSFQNNNYYFPTDKGDIWSLGIIIINITCSRNPWPKASITDLEKDDSTNVFIDYMIRQNHFVLSQILPISQQFNHLLNKIFKLDPSERIDLSHLYQAVYHLDFFNDLSSPPPTDEEDDFYFDEIPTLSHDYQKVLNHYIQF